MELPPPPPPPPERSKRLHNFTLPYLRWGQQRFLRCVKLPPSSSSSPSPDRAHHGSQALPGDGKLKLDLVPKVSILGNGGEEKNNNNNNNNNNGDVVAAARPWNLRTRRAACNEPGDESAKIIESSSTLRIGENNGDLMKKNEKVKFSVSLLREEIEEDFSSLIGKKPPRRPKKRPRLVQKQMNTLFPGLWLGEEVTPESYDVPESVET